MNQGQDGEIDAIDNTPAQVSDEEQTVRELSRRELMLTAGALGIAALFGTGSASAQGAAGARQARPAFGPELFSHENLSNFAGLTTKIWADPALGERYDSEPRKVLAEFNVRVPAGVPTPLIPKQPKGGIKNINEAWQRNDFGAADLLIKEVGNGSARLALNTGSSISTLGCPLSTCNSFFCYIVARPTDANEANRIQRERGMPSDVNTEDEGRRVNKKWPTRVHKGDRPLGR